VVTSDATAAAAASLHISTREQLQVVYGSLMFSVTTVHSYGSLPLLFLSQIQITAAINNMYAIILLLLPASLQGGWNRK